MHVRMVAHGISKEPWLSAIVNGFRRHGIHVVYGRLATYTPGEIAVCWGWKQGKRERAAGAEVLVIERGYVSGRGQWISLGWNGLNGRAIRPYAEDGGERWRTLFGDLMQPWREGGDCIIVMGQVANDAAVLGQDMPAWYAHAAAKLQERGLPVLFRPHPRDVERDQVLPVPDVPTLHGELSDALDRAALVVTWNSGSGVDAALAGVPVIACDKGSMAWPVAAHGLDAELVRPDRDEWCARLAWCQWSLQEVRDGTAWEHLKSARNERSDDGA